MADITLYGIRTFGSLLAIGLHVLAYTYLQKLEMIDCSCAEDKKLRFMKFALFLMICFLFINMFIPIPDITTTTSTGAVVYAFIQLGVAAVALVYYIFMIQYINRLVRDKCRCSEDIRREVTYIYAILQLVMFSIMFLIMLLNGTLFYSSPLRTMMKSKTRILENMQNPLSGLKKTTREVSKKIVKPISGRRVASRR